MGKQKKQLQAKSGNKSIHISEEVDDSLPSPEILERYKTVDPKLIEFLMEHTKKEQDARLELTKNMDKRNYKLARSPNTINLIGVLCATTIVLCFLIGSVFLMINNKPALGISSIIIAFISFLSIFAKRNKKK